jgi:hypothetical protein
MVDTSAFVKWWYIRFRRAIPIALGVAVNRALPAHHAGSCWPPA